MPSENRTRSGTQEIHDEGAEHEEDRGGDQVRQERLALMTIKPGSHEHIELRGDTGNARKAAPNIASLICVTKYSSSAV